MPPTKEGIDARALRVGSLRFGIQAVGADVVARLEELVAFTLEHARSVGISIPLHCGCAFSAGRIRVLKKIWFPKKGIVGGDSRRM